MNTNYTLILSQNNQSIHGFAFEIVSLCLINYTLMSTPPNSEEFYTKLKAQLEDTATWPTAYLYKFIVKSNDKKIVDIENIFDNMGAVINTNQSKNGKYTSVSINVTMNNPDAVIEKYKEVAEKIEGVISL